VSAAVGSELAARGFVVQASCHSASRGHGSLELWPGARRLHVDRIVTLPRLVGPRLRDVPCDRDGFLVTDSHGRVAGMNGIFAAGDATTFPVKQGGLAAQQAVAVAQTVAASVGADVSRSTRLRVPAS
jgi:sulfide:quinone oxidoreductase